MHKFIVWEMRAGEINFKFEKREIIMVNDRHSYCIVAFFSPWKFNNRLVRIIFVIIVQFWFFIRNLGKGNCG